MRTVLCLLVVLFNYTGCQATELKLSKDGKYFVQIEEEFNYDQAKAFCSENGMSLVTVDTPEKEQTVIDLVVEAKTAVPPKDCKSTNQKKCEYKKNCDISYIWTSGYEVEKKEPREFTWTTTNKSVSGYTNWGDTQPNNWAGDEQRCLELDVSIHFGVGDWNDERCTGKNGFVCEKQ